jgi:sugar phosphate isomerase/epimerase
LTKEFKIKVAIHNHPKPSHYWDPQVELDAIKDHSKAIGACADTGHWPRSGIAPMDGLKKMAGHIISLHFKDIAPADKTGIDLPWGTGKSNARGQLEVLRQQGFRGAISIEYETGAGAELEANVTKCIAWFDNTCRAIETKAGK